MCVTEFKKTTSKVTVMEHLAFKFITFYKEVFDNHLNMLQSNIC